MLHFLNLKLVTQQNLHESSSTAAFLRMQTPLNAAFDNNTTFRCQFGILAVFAFAEPKYISECQIEQHCTFIAVGISENTQESSIFIELPYSNQTLLQCCSHAALWKM